MVYATRENEDFWLVSRYVEGRTLRFRLSERPLEIGEIIIVGRALFSALRDLHDKKILHRGIRPANLIVDGEGSIGSATLIDFGPIQPIEVDQSNQAHTLEVAMYCSPEQAGSIEYDLTPASDLYSAGAVLFHCLAGRPPFQGDTVGKVLFEHMTAPLPPLRASAAPIPRALEELVQRLLKKDPRDRYQSADAVLADLELIARALAQGDADPAIVIGAHDRRGTLIEPAFVARGEQLASLEAEMHKARQGAGALVLLEAESGGGKTRLLEETAHRAARQGFWILRGQGTSEVAQQPFRLLDGIVDGVLAEARSNTRFAENLSRQLAEHCDAIVAALPALAPLFLSQTPAAMAPEETGEARTIQALAHFLDAIGAGERPALIIVDDCQWADELTYKLINRWHADQRARVARRRHTFIVAAFRSEEVAAENILRRIESAKHLRLPPFTHEQVRQLVESMAGRLPDQVTERIQRLAEGSPFMASAVLRGFVESGALRAGPDGWIVDSAAMADVGSSSRAASFLALRLNLLPAESVELLSTGAILGKEFDLQMALHLAGHDSAKGIEALDEARRRQLVWLRPDGTNCVFVHDKIRAAALERIDVDRRQYLHRQSAAFLLVHSPERVSDLAYHFDAAGDSASAFEFAIQAAKKARSQHALEIAEQQYRIALRGAASDDARFQIIEGLGETLMLRGRYDAAGELFQSAATVAQGNFAKAEVREKLGELAFKRGDMSTAIDHFNAAMALLGRRVPKTKWGALNFFLWESFVQLLHTAIPKLFLHRVKRPPNDAERLALRLLSNLAHGCWYCRSRVLALWAHLRGLNLGERFQSSRELVHAYAEHGPGMTLFGAYGRGIAYAERAIQMSKSLGDIYSEGQSLVYYGITLYAASRFNECVDKCRTAVRLLERMGDYWQVHMARYQLAASLYHLGDLRSAVEESQLNYKSGIETGDEQASGIILDIWARAIEGAVPADILDRELKRTRTDAQGTAQVLLADGLRHFATGDFQLAIEVFKEAQK